MSIAASLVVIPVGARGALQQPKGWSSSVVVAGFRLTVIPVKAGGAL
jgi:hypothetical protein